MRRRCASGRSARRRIEEARELIAGKLGSSVEVIFTAGGTATTWLSKVSIERRDGSRTAVASSPPRWNTTTVLDSVNLARGTRRRLDLTPCADGSVSATALREALQSHGDVALVSVMVTTRSELFYRSCQLSP